MAALQQTFLIHRAVGIFRMVVGEELSKNIGRHAWPMLKN